MSDFIQKKHYRLTTLTPVHISDGSEGDIIPTEYVVSESGRLHKVNLAKLIGNLPEKSLPELMEYMNKEDLIKIRDFIQSIWKKYRDIFSDCIEYSMQAGDLREYYENMQNEYIESKLYVTPFIRTGRQIYLPASSVKGALRTAYISKLFEDGISINMKKPNIDKKSKRLEEDILRYSYLYKGRRKINVTKDPFKVLKISDSSVLSVDGIVKKIEIISRNKNGDFDAEKMKDTKLFAEVIEREIEIDIEARIDSRYFNVPRGLGKKITFGIIENSCREFYKKLLLHERDSFFKDFDRKIKKSQIFALYDNFLQLNESPNSFLLRLGKHSGRNSLSLNLINKKGIEPKSRKLIVEDGEYLPMGWVKVTVS